MSKDNPPSQRASTLRQKHLLPSHDDLMQMFSTNSGPVKDSKSAKAYLSSKSCFLQEEGLTPLKLSKILFPALLAKGIPSEVQAVVKAVAFAIVDAEVDSFTALLASKT